MQTPPGIPDYELVSLASQGDEDAFRALVDRYKDYVYHLCVRVSGSRSDGEDLAQECFIKLYKNLGRYRKEHKLSNWLYTIALNDCRKLLRRRRIVRFFSLDASPGEEGPRPQVVDLAMDPGQQLDNSQLGQRLAVAVSQLPQDLRAVFVMRHEMGEEFSAIAAALGKKPEHIRVLLFRARQRLQEILGPVIEGELRDKEG